METFTSFCSITATTLPRINFLRVDITLSSRKKKWSMCQQSYIAVNVILMKLFEYITKKALSSSNAYTNIAVIIIFFFHDLSYLPKSTTRLACLRRTIFFKWHNVSGVLKIGDIQNTNKVEDTLFEWDCNTTLIECWLLSQNVSLDDENINRTKEESNRRLYKSNNGNSMWWLIRLCLIKDTFLGINISY